MKFALFINLKLAKLYINLELCYLNFMTTLLIWICSAGGGPEFMKRFKLYIL
jgi:hypothetical protein